MTSPKKVPVMTVEELVIQEMLDHASGKSLSRDWKVIRMAFDYTGRVQELKEKASKSNGQH
jgi:hypothetical protein